MTPGDVPKPPAPRISVVVPVYNASRMILGAIEALDRQTLAKDEYEVIMVDDGSADGTAELIETQVRLTEMQLRLVRLPRNSGPAAARNAGIASARAKNIAFTDADCEPDPDWLERALDHLKDEVVDAVEGRTVPKGKPGPTTHQMINTSGGLYMTCNMVYRRDVLADIGGFDERFRAAFLEDSDLALSLLERDGEIRWAPDMVVRHLVIEEGLERFAKDARKRYWNPLLRSKHPAGYDRHIRPVVPGLPRLHLRFLASVAAFPIPILVGLPGGSVLIAFLMALYGKRVLHAYRARTFATAWRALLIPFQQTFHVLRGAVKFRSFSFRL